MHRDTHTKLIALSYLLSTHTDYVQDDGLWLIVTPVVWRCGGQVNNNIWDLAGREKRSLENTVYLQIELEWRWAVSLQSQPEFVSGRLASPPSRIFACQSTTAGTEATNTHHAQHNTCALRYRLYSQSSNFIFSQLYLRAQDTFLHGVAGGVKMDFQ